MNKLLTNEDRKAYEPLIKDMFVKCPAMMSRKIKEANVQQAFVVDSVLKLIKASSNKDINILCVGSYEDTDFEYLKTLGVKMESMDPELNVDLHTFKDTNTKKWDIVFSTSVLEHVEDDELFVKDICELLNDSGTAVLTCDFKEGYKVGDPLIQSDFRFYTQDDLNVRLNDIIKSYGCELVSEPLWAGSPDFFFAGFAYNFATWVFKKV